MFQKTTQFLLLTLLAASSAYGMEWLPSEQKRKEDAFITELEDHLKSGGNINEINKEFGCTVLVFAAERDYARLCQRLVREGADITIQDKCEKTALDYAAMRSNENRGEWIYRMMVSQSQFTPYYTQRELAISKRKTYYALWVLKQVFPEAPHDLKRKLLGTFPQFWRDVLCTPLRLHASCYCSVQYMPMQTIRELVKHGALEQEKVVAALRAHKMAHLEPLMNKVAESISSKRGLDNMKALLDFANIEINFGADITRGLYECTGPNFNPAALDDDPFPDERASVITCGMQ